MKGMFDGCESLENIDLSNFNTQNVTYMEGMFNWCESLEKNNVKTKDNKILKQLENI